MNLFSDRQSGNLFAEVGLFFVAVLVALVGVNTATGFIQSATTANTAASIVSGAESMRIINNFLFSFISWSEKYMLLTC